MKKYELYITGINQDGEESEIDCFVFGTRKAAYEAAQEVYTDDFYAGINGLYTYVKEIEK